MKLIIIVILLLHPVYSVIEKVRICPSLQDYNKFFNKKCSIIKNANITEIIQNWPGFTAEEHYLTTEDGYRVLVERAYSKITQKNPIILVHGLGANAFGWVNRGNVSLARLLGNLGYDVWMLNIRGTWYSKNHVNLTTSDPKYWEFTIDKISLYDVRSAVKLVYKYTKRQAIYIGYSLGTTTFFMYSSTYPKEAEKYIKGMICLAPVLNYKGARSIARLLLPVWPSIKRFIYTFWNGEVLPGFSIFLRPFLRTSAGMYFIQYVANYIFGDDFEQMDSMTYPIFATQLLDTGGVEVFSHYYQILETNEFKKYDFGYKRNLEIYGTSIAPSYNLLEIPVPLAIFVGENDYLSTVTNAKDIYAGIQSTLRCGFEVIPYKKWNHLDFLIAKDLPKYLYKHLFKKIREFGDGICRK